MSTQAGKRLRSRGCLGPVGVQGGGAHLPCPKFCLSISRTKLGHKYTHRHTIPMLGARKRKEKKDNNGLEIDLDLGRTMY